MSSTNVVNFSLRQNKAIERSIVFDGMRLIVDRAALTDLVYVGFGSVWFSDFHLAHRTLDIRNMISIEWDPITYARAAYNRPFSTVEVIQGSSDEITPGLLRRADLTSRPWVLWLDYDRSLDSEKLTELSGLIQALPADSFLITTYQARPGSYGNKEQRLPKLENLFGTSAPQLPAGTLIPDADLSSHLAESTERYLTGAASQFARRGGYVPCFRLAYEDATPMVTVGGFLPGSAQTRAAAVQMTGVPSWNGRLSDTITTPPLTTKEALALQQLLPSDTPVTQADVQQLGFDLLAEQIRSFQEHYLRYPTFSQLQR